MPARTGLGVPLFVTAMSHLSCTYTAVVVVLLAVFGSDVVDDTVEIAVVVPEVADAETSTTTTMFAEAPAAKLAESVHVIVPVEPTGGVVQVHPAGARTEAKVVCDGVASVKVTPVAAAGPLFVIVCVYVMELPANTGLGVPTVANATSACPAVPTTSDATAELAPYDWFDAFTVTVSLMTVPAAVPAFTL